MNIGWIVCMSLWGVFMGVWGYKGPYKRDWFGSLPYVLIALFCVLCAFFFS